MGKQRHPLVLSWVTTSWRVCRSRLVDPRIRVSARSILHSHRVHVVAVDEDTAGIVGCRDQLRAGAVVVVEGTATLGRDNRSWRRLRCLWGDGRLH